MNVIVDCGAVPALVQHLQAPLHVSDGEGSHMPYEHEVEKGSAFTLGLLSIKVIILFFLFFFVGYLLVFSAYYQLKYIIAIF